MVNVGSVRFSSWGDDDINRKQCVGRKKERESLKEEKGKRESLCKHYWWQSRRERISWRRWRISSSRARGIDLPGVGLWHPMIDTFQCGPLTPLAYAPACTDTELGGDVCLGWGPLRLDYKYEREIEPYARKCVMRKTIQTTLKKDSWFILSNHIARINVFFIIINGFTSLWYELIYA